MIEGRPKNLARAIERGNAKEIMKIIASNQGKKDINKIFLDGEFCPAR